MINEEKEFVNSTAATIAFEKLRWGDKPTCPHCKNLRVKKVKNKFNKRNKRCLWRCYDCKKQFTVRIGTIMESSRLPLNVWWLIMCAYEAGENAHQVSKRCGITYKTMWRIMNKQRNRLESFLEFCSSD